MEYTLHLSLDQEKPGLIMSLIVVVMDGDYLQKLKQKNG